MCQQFRFDNKSQFRVFLAKPQKAADLKLPLVNWEVGKLFIIVCVAVGILPADRPAEAK